MISKKILSILFTVLLAGFALEQKIDCSSSVAIGNSESNMWSDLLLSEAYGLHRIAVAVAGLGLFYKYGVPVIHKAEFELYKLLFEKSKGQPIEAYLYAHVDGQNKRSKVLVKKDMIMLVEPYPLSDGRFVPEGTVAIVGYSFGGSRLKDEEIITMIIDSIWDAIEDREGFQGRDDNFMNTLEIEVITTLKDLGYSVEQDYEGALIIDNSYKVGPLLSQGYLVGRV